MPRIPAAQRRQDFVNAAVEVIATHGIDGATTRRIADQANANLAMVHYCYDSKEDLFGDVFVMVANKFREISLNVDPSATLEEAAHAILHNTMELYLESSSFTVTAIELINWARRQHGDRGIAVYTDAINEAVATLRATAEDRAVDEATLEEIAAVIGFLADGFAVSWITYGDRELAARQMPLADSVLASWLAAHIPAPVVRRKRAAAKR